ncbi:MAG TPA: aryl-sulfate sulfotransferase [Bacteroidota bacterium]|nr:aryl-sulfate sulfotransferase [Bacteroidota bacterium]
MRLSCLVFLFVLLAVVRSPAAGVPAPGPLRVVYVSPLPSSPFNLPLTSIIVRTETPPGLSRAQGLVRTVVGDASGSHACAVRISDDNRTVIFRPSIPFAPGERVTVSVDTAVASWPHAASGGTFEFTVSSHMPDRQALRENVVRADVRRAGSYHPPADSSPGRPLDISLPAIHVTVDSTTAPGYLFLSDQGWSAVAPAALLILNNDGTPVFARDLNSFGYDFKPQPDGTLTYFTDESMQFLVLDRTYTLVDSIAAGNGYVTDPHELRILPNGHALLLALDDETVDMSKLVAGGFNDATVVGYVIQELDTSRDVVFQWRSWDHYTITDAEHIDFIAPWIDDVHGNALDVDTDGNILFSSRHMNEVDKIDRQTGAFLWRLGGAHNQFTFVNDSIGFSFQHAVRRIANGDITLFDNGNFHVPAFSRAVEYRIDTAAMTATLVWQYRNKPDAGGFAMGYVQRLDNGNTLIGWGATNPTVTEVAPDGTKLYEMSFDPGVYSYRAFREAWDGAAVTSVAPSSPSAFRLAQNFPNPFNPTTTIEFTIATGSRVTLDVTNILGEVVARLVDGERSPGTYRAVFDGSRLPSGVYFYRLRSGENVATMKCLLIR